MGMQNREEEKAPQVSLLSSAEERAQIRDKILMSNYHVIDEPRSVASLVAQGHFPEAIQKLHLEKDREDGVISYYARLPDHPEHTILIRDARAQETAPKESYHNWAIMGLNYAHAAKKLLEAHEKKIEGAKLKDTFHEKTRLFLENIKDSSDPEKAFQEFVNSLIPLLREALPELSKKDIQEQLADIRDFCNFEHDTLSVATRMSVPDEKDGHETTRDIFQIDIPMCGNMPDELRAQYQALADLQQSNNAFLEGKPVSDEEVKHMLQQDVVAETSTEIPWYKDQPPHIKYLMRHHAKDILAGKMIPTQLRKYLPGLRNTGEEFLVVVDAKLKKVDIIQHHYHSGTPGHLLADTKQSQTATNQSLAQLKKLTGAQHVLALTLLSPGNPRSDDTFLVNQVENAVAENNKMGAEKQFHTCNIPLNPMRYLNGISRFASRMSGAEWLHRQALRRLDGSLRSTAYYDDMTPPQKNALLQDLEKLGKCCEEYDALRSGSGIVDPENRNLQLVSVLTQMAHLVNKIHRVDHPTEENDFVALQISCQSGKDRAGLSRLKTILDALKRYINPLSHQEESITKAVINAQHIGLQAGLAGGTIGASGLKNDTKRALPFSMKQYMNDLFKRTASYNKKLPKKPNKQTKPANQSSPAVEQPEPVAVKVAEPEAVAIKIENKQEEAPMISIPFPTSYFLANPEQAYQELMNPIVYTPQIIQNICEAAARTDLHRLPWVITNDEPFIKDLKARFDSTPTLTLKQAKKLLEEYRKAKIITQSDEKLEQKLDSILLRIPQLTDKKIQEISDFRLSESSDLPAYTQQMCKAIGINNDEALALFTARNGINGQFEQGGIVNASTKLWGAYISVSLGVMIHPTPTTTLAITKNPDGSSFTIKSTFEAESCWLLGGDNDVELQQPPFKYNETYTLKKNAEGNWELALLQDPPNNLQVHPKVWAHMLEQAHKKLKQPKFSSEDLFVFIPWLIDKDFTKEFQENLSKVPEKIRGNLLVLIENYYGKKENQPEHVKNLVTRIKVLQEDRKTIEDVKAPPKELQFVQQPPQPSSAEPKQKKGQQHSHPTRKLSGG
jgi:hypothetical protein